MSSTPSITLENLYKAVSEDFPVNQMDLTREAVKTSELFVKYIRLWSDEKLRLELLENKRKHLHQEKYDYYSGNAPAEVYKEKPCGVLLKTAAAILKYIETDPDVVKFNEQVLVQKQKVDILDACLKEIKNRPYQIKAAIDMTKFEAGA